MKKFVSILFILTAFLFVSFSAWASEKTLRLAIVQEWSAFNPVNSQLASNEALMQLMIRKMVARQANGKVLADVAEAVPALKNKSATWKIKKNAKWGDGHDITCEDWELGWKTGLNPNVSVETRTYYSKITSIKWTAEAPQTCLVEYEKQDWSYDRDLPPLLPSHLEKSVFEKHSKTSESYDRNSSYVTYPNLAGLYNGPYTVTEFKLGRHIIFSRNKYFYGTKPEYDKVIVTHIPDTSALKANLASKQIDGISAVGFPPDTAITLDEEFQQNKDSLYRVDFQNSAIFQGVFFNLDKDLFKDKKVREALARAIDKEALVKAFYQNKLKAAEGILPPQHPSFKKTVPVFSKKTAISLLESSGWKPGPDGVRSKEGKKLSFIFKTSAGIKVLENIQVFICDQFKDIGAQCVIKNEPPRVLLGSSVPHGEFDITMFGQPIPPDTSLSSYFSSSEIPTNANSWAGGNSLRVRSIEMDLMLKEFDNEFTPEKRNKIAHKIENYFQNEFSFIPLYHRREAIVMPKKLEGVEDSFEGTSYFQPENWKLKTN